MWMVALITVVLGFIFGWMFCIRTIRKKRPTKYAQKSIKKQVFHPLKKLKEVLGKIGTLNLVLILVGVFFVWFNWQMLAIFRVQGNIPETYACAVVAATIGECGICGWIRTNKDRKREHQWEQEEKQAEKLEKMKESEVAANERNFI